MFNRMFTRISPPIARSCLRPSIFPLSSRFSSTGARIPTEPSSSASNTAEQPNSPAQEIPQTTETQTITQSEPTSSPQPTENTTQESSATPPVTPSEESSSSPASPPPPAASSSSFSFPAIGKYFGNFFTLYSSERTYAFKPPSYSDNTIVEDGPPEDQIWRENPWWERFPKHQLVTEKDKEVFPRPMPSIYIPNQGLWDPPRHSSPDLSTPGRRIYNLLSVLLILYCFKYALIDADMGHHSKNQGGLVEIRREYQALKRILLNEITPTMINQYRPEEEEEEEKSIKP